MILAMGFSFYEIVNRIERSSAGTLLEMAALERDAADEDLDIQRVRLTGGNSLNLTIKNTGSVFSELEWIGVFDDTLSTQSYYRVNTAINPIGTRKDIGNTSIVMNPANKYTIQVLTNLGNIYYGEYPEPTTGGTGGGGGVVEAQFYFVDTAQDSQAPTESGTHSLFSAMQAGPDEIYNTFTEGTTVGSLGGLIDDVLVDTLEFDTQKGKTSELVHVSGDVYVIAYAGEGDDGFLKTVEISTSGAITNTVIDTLEFDTNNGKTPFIQHISGDVYAIAYEGQANDGFLITVVIATNGVITNTVIDTYEFDSGQGKTPRILHISGDVYAIVYEGQGEAGTVVTVEIAANGSITNSNIDTLEFEPSRGKTPKIIPVSGDVYAITYAGFGDDGFLTTVEIASNGAITNTVIDSYEFDPVKGKTPDIIHVSGTTYAIAYSADTDVGKVITVDIATNGAITNSIIDSLQFVEPKGKDPEIKHLIDDVYMVAYQDTVGPGVDPGVLSTLEILANGDISASVIDSLVFDAVKGKTPALLQISSDVYAIAYAGAGDDGHVSTVNFQGGGGDYTLDLEVAWSDLPSKTNEYLTIYGGTMGAETLLVDYWDGGAWINLSPSITSGWNIIDVSSVLSSSSFTIRFVDATQTSDAVQDTWEIEFVYLNLFD